MYNRYTRPLLYYAKTAAKAPQVASKPVGATRRGAQAVATSRRCSLLYQDQDQDQGQGQGQGRRTFTTSAAVMASPANSQAAPQFSAGVDEPALTRTLETLLASAGHGGRWVLIASGEGLERSFKFKTFAKTWVSQPYHTIPYHTCFPRLLRRTIGFPSRLPLVTAFALFGRNRSRGFPSLEQSRSCIISLTCTRV